MLAVVSPLGAVEQMRAPVGQHAARIILNPPEVPVTAAFRIRRPRRGADPHIIIETIRNRHRLRIARRARPARKLDADRMNLTDPAVSNQFTHSVILVYRSILGGPLKDPAVTFHYIAQHPALFDGQRRFFALDVFARFGRGDRNRYVPMVRRRNHHRIYIVPCQNLPEIAVRRTVGIAVFLVDHVTGDIAVNRIDIANGNSLSIRIAQKVIQVDTSTVTARTNESHRNPPARSDRACVTKRR